MKFQSPSIHHSKLSNCTEMYKNQRTFQNSIILTIFKVKISKVNLVIFSATIIIPNMKTRAQTLFEISCTQDFQILLPKGHNSKKGHNLDMKTKYRSTIFFMRNLSKWNFKTLVFTVQKFQISPKSR